MSDSKRKLAAIVFTDIVGFTNLTSKNQQKASDLLDIQRNLLKPLVESYSGKWVKEMGDGLILTFDTINNAVECCLKIQEKSKEIDNLVLRIGIHLGEILEKENDIIGDDVNVTARIEPFSAPGGIAISNKINDAIIREDGFDTKYLGKPKLKGVGQEVKVYCITSHGLPETILSNVSAKLEPEGFQLPVVESQYIDMDQGEIVEGEFLASDMDGNIFWYNVETQPEYGNLEVYGGRKRKFKYHAPENFSGLVEIEVSATDDKGATGSSTLITFNISGELGADIRLNAEKFTISKAFPNPFNPSTTLNFNVQEELTLNITIYNILGKRVKNLVSNKYTVGDHSVSWDSRNGQGNLVSAGMYIYTIQAGEFRQTRKMVLLK